MSQLAERLKQRGFESEGQEAVLSLLMTGTVLRDKMNALCTENGISLQQYNILRILHGRHPEGYARCDISERMIEKAPDTTRLIDRLARAGLVKREKTILDMRQSLTTITEKGISVLKTLNKKIRDFQNMFETGLTPAACKQISALCDKVLQKV